MTGDKDTIFNERDFYEQISEKVIVFFTWNLLQREFPYHVAAIANSAKLSKSRMILIDANQLSNLETKHYDSVSYFKELNSRFDVEVVQMKTTKREVLKDFGHDRFRNLKQLEQHDAELYRSILSSWLSKNLVTLTVDKLDRKLQRLLSQEVAEYTFWRANAEPIIEKYGANLVIIMNGRHHTNIAVRRGAQAIGVKHLFFESGVPKKERIFLQYWQPHDVLKFGDYCSRYAQLLEGHEKREAINWAEVAIQQNRYNSTTNPHLLFQRNDSSLKPNNGTIVPIFTSSINEAFSNLAHPLNGWESPNDAVVETAIKVRSMGFIPLVRIHPNAGWKSCTELLELIEKLNTSQVDYFLPWSSKSSYSLIQDSKFFVSWYSTLALEGTAMGVHAYTLAKTHYEKVSDVQSISKENLSTWKPQDHYKLDPNKSLLQYYIQNNQGVNLGEQAWVANSSIVGIEVKYRKTLTLFKIAIKAIRSPLKARPYDFYFPLIKILNKSLADKAMCWLLNLMLKYRRLRSVK